MIKSIVREFNWEPKTIGSLFIDNIDYLGLEFWYEDVLQTSKELEAKSK